MPNETVVAGSEEADGSYVVQLPNASTRVDWIQVLPVRTNLVSCKTDRYVSYLEYMDRLAQFLELKVGVLTNGTLIFGANGHWPTNYMPAYTIELDVRYRP